MLASIGDVGFPAFHSARGIDPVTARISPYLRVGSPGFRELPGAPASHVDVYLELRQARHIEVDNVATLCALRRIARRS
jgi:hypothetical protein